MPRILVIDDDDAVRESTERILRGAGYMVESASGGEAGFGLARQGTFDVILSDMRMPGMSGLELYEALVAAGHTIPTVIITAHPEELTQSRARAAGICCYLSKPFAPDELLECVGEALARSRGGPIPRS